MDKTILFALVSGVIGGLITYFLVPLWIGVARKNGLLGRDMNKNGNVLVAEAGGIWVIVSAAFSLMLMQALYTYTGSDGYPTRIYALTALLLLSALIGFLDDILGWKKGVPRKIRVLALVPVSLPLVVIKAGTSTMDLPFIGVVDLGILYPLVLVPIGIVGAANGFNMIGGFNGLEAGMGFLLMLFTAIYAYMNNVSLAFQASLIMVFPILVFLLYNWYPARVFPGNTFTYGLGAYYASVIIMGNMEKFGLFLFIPYFVKAIMYLRAVIVLGTTKLEAFGIPRDDGSLKTPHHIIYSWGQLGIRLLEKIKGRAYEWEVVLFVLSIEVVVGLLALFLAYIDVL